MRRTLRGAAGGIEAEAGHALFHVRHVQHTVELSVFRREMVAFDVPARTCNAIPRDEVCSGESAPVVRRRV
jgi:hypothetical protein